MEISIDKIGSRIVKVRGIGGSFASGNLKIMLNEVAMNSALSALAQPVMNMPIEQIERIEIIRGPGSAIHGEFAYAGVINVITKKNKNRIFSGIGENNERLLGGTYSWEFPDKKINAHLNVAIAKTDGEETENPSDALFMTGTAIGLGQAGISNAPGSSSEERGYKSILFNLEVADYLLKVQWLNDDHGAHFGALDVLPDDNDFYNNDFKTIELSREIKWSDQIESNFQFGWLEYVNKTDFSILPDGFGLWHYPNFPLVLDDGYLVEGYYKEDKLYAGMDLFWDISSKHSLLFGFNYSVTDIKDSWEKTNIHPNGTLSNADNFPIDTLQKFTFNDGLNWPSDDNKRELSSITLQDEYKPFEQLLITAGVRYDHYSDVGDNISPRIAAVYHLNDRHILKGQYAEAFRPPTFFESLWDPELDPQLINTFDFGYVYKGGSTNFKVTAFHSKLKDVITAITPLGFENAEGATIKGVEFEANHAFTEKLSLNFNLSYSKSKDDLTGEAIPRTTDWLSNLELMYKLTSQNDLSIRYRYVGEQHREENDPRDELDAYNIIDFTISFHDILSKGTTLQLGIDNLFNENVRYPAPMATDVLGTSFPSYENDYPREERRLWLRLKYDFD
jgi:iron complex outermembrane receptor protein